MTMTDRPLDAIVIGSGAAGLAVATGLARSGRHVALVESGRIGGGSTDAGCIPATRLAHLARDPARRGDPDGALADVRAMRDAVEARRTSELEALPGLQLVRGRATLAPGRRVMVHRPDDSVRTLSAPHVIVATGAHPRQADIPGLPDALHLTSETLFDLTEAPRHLAIIGAGASGSEIAGAFAGLGCRVTLVEASSWILPGADPEAGACLAAALRRAGVDLHTDTHPVEFTTEGGVLTLSGTGGTTRVEGVDMVLSAIGRTANTDVAAGVLAIGQRGITVDGWGRTSAPGVWAVGDVTGRTRQTHGAHAMARRLVRRITTPWLPSLGRAPVVPSAVFTDPEVAWVGPGAEERAHRYAPGALIEIRIDLPHTDRGLTDDVHRGFVAITAARGTGRVVAATVVGPRAGELLPLLTYAVERGVSLLRLQRQVYAYPTHAAAIGAAADEFARRTLPHLHTELAAYAGRRAAVAGRRVTAAARRAGARIARPRGG